MLHIKKIKPLFTSIITTAEEFKKDYLQNGIIVAKAGDVKPWQKVIAVGSSVRDIKEGDMVMVNLENYVVRKYDKNSIQNDMDNNPKMRLKMNYVIMDDDKGNPTECFLLNDRDIEYTFEGEETEDTPKKLGNIIYPNPPLVGIN